MFSDDLDGSRASKADHEQGCLSECRRHGCGERDVNCDLQLWQLGLFSEYGEFDFRGIQRIRHFFTRQHLGADGVALSSGDGQ